MKNKKIINIYKFSIVLSCVAFILTFVIPIVAVTVNFKNETIIYSCIYGFFSIALLSGLVVLIIPFVANKKSKKEIDSLFSYKKSTDKIKINKFKFEELLVLLNEKLNVKGYEKKKSYIENQLELHIFLKDFFAIKTSAFAVVYLEELTNANIEICEELIEDYFKNNNTVHFDNIDIITVFCVERSISSFDTNLNIKVEQDINISRFCSVVSLEESSLYIVAPNSKFAIAKYNKNKKFFMKFVDFLFHT